MQILQKMDPEFPSFLGDATFELKAWPKKKHESSLDCTVINDDNVIEWSGNISRL